MKFYNPLVVTLWVSSIISCLAAIEESDLPAIARERRRLQVDSCDWELIDKNPTDPPLNYGTVSFSEGTGNTVKFTIRNKWAYHYIDFVQTIYRFDEEDYDCTLEQRSGILHHGDGFTQTAECEDDGYAYVIVIPVDWWAWGFVGSVPNEWNCPAWNQGQLHAAYKYHIKIPCDPLCTSYIPAGPSPSFGCGYASPPAPPPPPPPPPPPSAPPVPPPSPAPSAATPEPEPPTPDFAARVGDSCDIEVLNQYPDNLDLPAGAFTFSESTFSTVKFTITQNWLPGTYVGSIQTAYKKCNYDFACFLSQRVDYLWDGWSFTQTAECSSDGNAYITLNLHDWDFPEDYAVSNEWGCSYWGTNEHRYMYNISVPCNPACRVDEAPGPAPNCLSGFDDLEDIDIEEAPGAVIEEDSEFGVEGVVIVDSIGIEGLSIEGDGSDDSCDWILIEKNPGDPDLRPGAFNFSEATWNTVKFTVKQKWKPFSSIDRLQTIYRYDETDYSCTEAQRSEENFDYFDTFTQTAECADDGYAYIILVPYDEQFCGPSWGNVANEWGCPDWGSGMDEGEDRFKYHIKVPCDPVCTQFTPVGPSPSCSIYTNPSPPAPLFNDPPSPSPPSPPPTPDFEVRVGDSCDFEVLNQDPGTPDLPAGAFTFSESTFSTVKFTVTQNWLSGTYVGSVQTAFRELNVDFACTLNQRIDFLWYGSTFTQTAECSSDGNAYITLNLHDWWFPYDSVVSNEWGCSYWGSDEHRYMYNISVPCNPECTLEAPPGPAPDCLADYDIYDETEHSLPPSTAPSISYFSMSSAPSEFYDLSTAPSDFFDLSTAPSDFFDLSTAPSLSDIELVDGLSDPDVTGLSTPEVRLGCDMDMPLSGKDHCPADVGVKILKVEGADESSEDAGIVWGITETDGSSVKLKIRNPFDSAVDVYTMYRSPDTKDVRCDGYSLTDCSDNSGPEIEVNCFHGEISPISLLEVFFVDQTNTNPSFIGSVEVDECCHAENAPPTSVAQYSFMVRCECPTDERRLRGILPTFAHS